MSDLAQIAGVAGAILTCSGGAAACCGLKAKQIGRMLTRSFRVEPTPPELLAILDRGSAPAAPVDAAERAAGASD